MDELRPIKKIMEIITTSKDIIARIEEALVRQANYGIHVKTYIAEALIEIENDGQTQKFRLREFSNDAKKEHTKLLKELSGNKDFDTDTLQSLDDFGRAFTIKDFTTEDFKKANALLKEVATHFNVKF